MEYQGYSSKLSTIGPVPRWWTGWWLPRVIWPYMRWKARLPGARARNVLMRTSTVNAAAWSHFDRIPPRPRGGNALVLKRPYLVFEANYSGFLPGYLEAFSFLDANGLRGIWQFAYEFPPNPARAGRFYDFVNSRQLAVVCLFSGYHGASTSMVRAALELRSRIDSFDRDYGQRPPGEFKPRWRDFVTDVQTICDPQQPHDAGKTWTFTAVTPVDPDDSVELGKRIRALSADKRDKMFPRRTHFASLALANSLLQPFLKPGESPDRTGFLVFSAVFDGVGKQTRCEALESWLATLHERLRGERADVVWGPGNGSSGFEQFRDHLKAHELPPDMPFASYPGRTVAEIDEALKVAREFDLLVMDAQKLDDAALKRRWDRFRRTRREIARAAWTEAR